MGGGCLRRIGATLILFLAVIAAAHADDRLRVAKSPGYLFAYTPLDIGIAKGIFRAKQIEIEEITFDGASKMDQAIVAGAVDIALGSPMDMAVAAKGMPSVAIADIAEPMLEFILLVPYDSPVKDLAGLKGKTFGIATIGSITQWAVLELAQVEGWGRDGVTLAAIGAGNQSAAAAMRAHLVDATVSTTMVGKVLERQQTARILARVPDYARPFIAHVMSASTAIIAERPDLVRRFVAGWFDAVAFMRTRREEAIPIIRTATGFSQDDEEMEYDLLLPEISRDGRFDPASLTRVAQSFADLGILDRPPDMSKLASEAFLPGNSSNGH